MTNDLSQLSILNWILTKGIVNEKGDALSYYDRPFLLDILTDWTPEIVIKKCAQIGGSVSFNIKALYAVKHLKLNVIYTMPSDDDVREFVSSKTNKVIQSNINEFRGMDADSIERKEIDDRFLFFKGTISKTAPIATSADLLIHDEASRSNQQALDTYKSRTKASQFKGRWIFSNPTTERDVVDQAWMKSDKKEWTITCEHCNQEQVLVFPDSIDLEARQFKCRLCHKHISDETRRKGKWVAQNPGARISGYHISLLMAPWITASEIIDDSEGDQEYFYNFVLGEPYNPGDLKVSRSMILDNWTPKSLETGHWFLGVDVGNIKHYVLGSESGITKVGKFSDWQVLDDMMLFYKPKLVIDAMPDNTMARYYVEKYNGALMSFFQENANNPQTIVWWGEGDRTGIVYSNRDRILDQMFDEMLHAKILYSVPSDKELLEYVKHFETLRRIKVTNNKGIERYVWESTTSVDHYVFATLYYYLSRLGNGNGTIMPSSSKPDYEFIGRDNKVGSFERLFQEKYGE
jgi:hypothetical protein